MLEALTNVTQQNTSVLNTENKKNNGDLFFEILSVELQNQNPLQPMDNSEWISQLTQIQSLNQTTEMTSEIKELKEISKFFQAANLVGKEIMYRDTNGDLIEGTVESITQKDSKFFVSVNGKEIPLDKVMTIEGEKNE